MLKYIALAALALTATAATARPLPERIEVVIKVTASDRADAAGHQRLMRKVSLAAEQVCGSYAAVEYQQWDRIEQCRAEAFRSVDRQLAAMKQPGIVRLAAR